MPNYIAMRHLKCAFQMTVQRCFQVTHLANHTAKSLYECPDRSIVIWGAELSDQASNHFRLYTARCIHVYRSTGNASSVHVWLAGYPDILPLDCKIPNSVSCVHCILIQIYILQLLLSCVHCTLRNSKCAIQMIIQITHFALMWKQSWYHHVTASKNNLASHFLKHVSAAWNFVLKANYVPLRTRRALSPYSYHHTAIAPF